jgi:hypothetical protein
LFKGEQEIQEDNGKTVHNRSVYTWKCCCAAIGELLADRAAAQKPPPAN